MKNIRYISNTLLLTTIISMFVMTGFVQAATTPTPINDPKYTLLEPLPSIDGTGNSTLQGEISLNTYIIYAVNLFIAIAAVAAVFMIVWGGFQYMTTDSWQGKTDGRKKATDAVIGLLMVLSTYIIMKTVNPALVNIPANLVPTITGMATSSARGLYDNLIGELNQLDSTAANSTNAARNAQQSARVTDLQNQLDEAQLNYDANCGEAGLEDPSCQQSYAEITDLQDELNTTGANLVVLVNNGWMDQEIRKVANDFTNIANGYTNSSYWFGPSNLDVVKTRIAAYEDEIKNVGLKNRYTELGLFPNSIQQNQQVTDKGNYTLAQVGAMGAIAIQNQYKNEPNAWITTNIITDLRRKFAALKYSDPSITQQAQDLLVKTEATLKANIRVK